METVIRAQSLHKSYGATVAVKDISFEVRRGEIFGVVGPNGAGKTTTVECLTGMRRPDSGRAEVLGLDPVKGGDELRGRIGVQLQQAALPDRLKVGEALVLYSSFYDSPVDWRELMHHWGLTGKRDTVFSDLSGGQRQRLFIALALVGDPEIVFLDELTSGLDPQARRASWELVNDIREAGKTVVLVTHFMDEAEALCDRVAVVDHGKLVALDSPRALIRALQAESSLSFGTENGLDPAFLCDLPGVSEAVREQGRVVVRGSISLLAPVAAELDRRGVQPRELRMEQATLEDVFLTLTGQEMRD